MTENDGGPRVWFITGASTGFGRELAEAVLSEGDRAVATARDAGRVRDLARAYPDRAMALQLDVTDREAIRRSVDVSVAAMGRIDVLVNNAGYGLIGAVEEVSGEEARAEFDTNFFGLHAMLRAVLPHMRERRSGHILNISSVGGVVANPVSGMYCATKFAVEGLSEALAENVGPLGIKVTIVEPGPFRTDFAGRSMATAECEIGDYAETVGEARARMAATSGNQPGDPALAARAMIRAVEAEEPPLRLPLGEYTLRRIREKFSDQLEEMGAWEDVALSTDRPKEAT